MHHDSLQCYIILYNFPIDILSLLMYLSSLLNKKPLAGYDLVLFFFVFKASK